MALNLKWGNCCVVYPALRWLIDASHVGAHVLTVAEVMRILKASGLTNYALACGAHERRCQAAPKVGQTFWHFASTVGSFSG
jgi:hypothetical protein